MELGKSEEKFLQLTKNNDFGKIFVFDNFSELKANFYWVYDRLKVIFNIHFESNVEYPPYLLREIDKQFEIFFRFYDPMKELYEYTKDKTNNEIEFQKSKKAKFRDSSFEERFDYIEKFPEWFKTIFTGQVFEKVPNNFLPIYQAVITLTAEHSIKELGSMNEFFANIPENRKNFDDLNTKINQNLKETNRILKETEDKIKDRTISDYALEFKKIADKYSSFNIPITFWKKSEFKFGLSQWSLLFGLLFIAGLVISIQELDTIFPIEPGNSTDIKVVQIVSRLLFVSLVVFLIGFFFRQYGIFQHLHTLNRHKQNALNSYKLFSGSFGAGEEGKEMKEALLREVAKAIYDFNTSGFISQKGNDGLPSILELTKIIKSSSSK